MDSAGELFGVVVVFAAFLMRERVPEGRDGFVGFVVGDFTWSRRSARAGLLVEFSEQCNVGRIVSPAGFGLHDEISVLVDADPVHGGDARVGGGEGPRGRVIGLGYGFFAPPRPPTHLASSGTRIRIELESCRIDGGQDADGVIGQPLAGRRETHPSAIRLDQLLARPFGQCRNLLRHPIPRGCERICERNAAQRPRWRGTRRDGPNGRLVVTCKVETHEPGARRGPASS